MSRSFARENNRCKSSVRNSSLSLKKNESAGTLSKDITKISSFLRAYGKVHLKKRFKSTRDLKTEEKTSISMTGEKFKQALNNPETIKSLTKIEKYSKKNSSNQLIENDILKTKSDLLDLKRDLATYEFEFFQNIYNKNIVQNLQVFQSKIEKSWKNFLDLGTEDLATKIKKSISNPIQVKKYQTKKVLYCFDVISRQNISVHQHSYKKTTSISGVKGLLSIKSTKETHKIDFLMPSGQVLSLILEKTLNDMSTSEVYFSEVEKKIIRNLFIETGTNDIQLGFDEKHLKVFATFYVKLKGLGNIVVRVTDAGDNFLIEAQNSLLVSKLVVQASSFQEDFQNVESFIKKQLFFYKKCLYFGENPFRLKETASKYLNDKYIDNLFDENLRKHCSFKYWYQEKLFKFEFYETSDGKFLRMTQNRLNRIFDESSYEFSLLLMLQSYEMSNCQKTLSRSLEIVLIIENLSGSP